MEDGAANGSRLDQTSDDDEDDDDDDDEIDEDDDDFTIGDRDLIAVPDEVLADVPPVEWGGCDIPLQPGLPPVPSNYQCALYPVPLDWADPDNGETVNIAMVKRPAGPAGAEAGPDPAPLGSLFLHPGGPAGSGAEIVALAGEFLYEPEVLEAYDLIGFDSRFTGYSEGLQCFDGTEDLDRYIIDDFAWPETRAEVRRQNRVNKNFDRLCERNDDRGRDYMSTTDVVHDLNMLHRAEGNTWLNLAGYSYASLIGAYFSNIYPDRVGAIIVDGVVDPQGHATGYTEENPPPIETVEDRDEDVPLLHRTGDGSAVRNTHREFLRLCDEAGPELCDFAPDAAERFDALLAAVGEKPVVLPGFVVDDRVLQSIVQGNLYNSVNMPTLASTLAFFETVVDRQGDVASIKGGAAMAAAVADDLEQAAASVSFPLNVGGEEQFHGVNCSDARDPDNIRAWVDNVDGKLFTESWLWGDSPCASWSGRDINRFEGPWDSETRNPVLVANTTYDAATPFEGARLLSERLPNSTLLIVEGWNHTTPSLSLCATEFQTNYLLTRELPGGEVVCRQDLLPFGVPATATPVDRYGTPIDADPSVVSSLDSAAEPLEPVVDSADEVRRIAAAERVPEELLDQAKAEELAELRLTEDEVSLSVKAAATAMAFEQALRPADRRFSAEP